MACCLQGAVAAFPKKPKVGLVVKKTSTGYGVVTKKDDPNFSVFWFEQKLEGQFAVAAWKEGEFEVVWDRDLILKADAGNLEEQIEEANRKSEEANRKSEDANR